MNVRKTIGPESESTSVLHPDVTRIVNATTDAGGGATVVAGVAAGAKIGCVTVTEKENVSETESVTESGNAPGHAHVAAPGQEVEVCAHAETHMRAHAHAHNKTEATPPTKIPFF